MGKLRVGIENLDGLDPGLPNHSMAVTCNQRSHVGAMTCKSYILSTVVVLSDSDQ